MLVCVIESKLLHYLDKLKRYIVSSGILHVTIAASCVLANSIVFQMAINNWIELSAPVGRLNKKDGLTRYGDSHVKDKTS